MHKDKYTKIRAMRLANAVEAARIEVQCSTMLASIYGMDSSYGDRLSRDLALLDAMIDRKKRRHGNVD